jgi:hypothetical protein
MNNASSPYPELFRVRQRFQSHGIDVAEIPQAVEQTLAAAGLSNRIESGQRVAIAVGSRGIANLSRIVAAVVHFVQAAGGEPMIVPAMGSHGGATAEGQAAVLAGYGIDPDSMGCPIASSMETVHVGTTSDGVVIHFDKTASQADHVIVVNRIKPHTRLVGKFESGLVKMLMIGLGKHRGATLYHQVFPDYDYYLDRLATQIVAMILDRMPITLGLGIVEDAFEHTSLIEAVTPETLLTKEPELLEIAKSRMPRLPFDRADLLIVDRIGKEISGAGMDTNVIGRKSNDRCAAPDEYPKIRQIYARSLTEKSSGNACGVGLADYGHRRLVEAMNADVTRVNCVTAAHVTGGAIPVTFESDRDVLDAVVSQTSKNRVADLSWLHISDTLNVSELACSRVHWDEARQRDDLEVLCEPQPLAFDEQGDFAP